jgi:hypothetical protein
MPMANVNGGGVQPLVSEAVDRPDPPELHIQPDFFFSRPLRISYRTAPVRFCFFLFSYTIGLIF